jgi:hypothetical protein
MSGGIKFENVNLKSWSYKDGVIWRFVAFECCVLRGQ